MSGIVHPAVGELSGSLAAAAVIGLVLGGLVALLSREASRQRAHRAGRRALWTSPAGLEPGERVVDAWQGERYFGPLVAGSRPSLGMRIWCLARQLDVLGWYSHQGSPARFHGAELWVRLTDQGRLVVTAEERRAGRLRPVPRSPAARARRLSAPVPLLVSGPADRAAVQLAGDQGSALMAIERSRPDRPVEPTRSRYALVELAPADQLPLLVWVEREAAARLAAWSAGEPAAHGTNGGPSLTADLAAIAGADVLTLSANGGSGVPEVARAYQRLRAAGSTPRAELEVLVRTATPAGRVYAALLLRALDPVAGRRAFAALRRDQAPVTRTDDGMLGHTTVANALRGMR
jgi:hypothetical protein